MNNITNKTIREIALENPATVRVFEEFKIDYCCGGRKSLEEACASLGVNPQIVSQKLASALDNTSGSENAPERKPVGELADYIVANHHVFTKKEIERLTPLMEKVCSRHGEQHPELFELQKAFQELCYDLVPHFQKEEMVLFPFIKRLEIAFNNDLSAPRPPFGTVQNPIRMMMTEHDTAGDILRKMREITAHYALPMGACPSYTALYFGFEELEKDLHQHIHLENNVLFPRAMEMENAVAQSAFV